MGKRWIAGVVAATWFVAACGASGGSDADPPTTTKPKAAATTTTEDPTAEVGADFQGLADQANEAMAQEATARDQFAADNDLQGAIDSTRDLRNDLYDFDAAVRDLDVPEANASAANDVLTANGRYIELLDGFLDVEDIPAYNAQLGKETEVRTAWVDAVNALADDLGADGIESTVGDDGSSDDEPTTTEATEEVQAGGTVSDGSLSIEVPEGFTASASSVITMEDDQGTTVGIYSVFPDESATTLAKVAKASAEGAAEKNDLEIIGGPEDLEVGDFPAIGYSSKDQDGRIYVDVYFDTKVDADNRFRVISVDVAEENVDDVMSAVEAVAPTVKLED
jgi:hypothetical protein